jgi:hypothetical protein
MVEARSARCRDLSTSPPVPFRPVSLSETFQLTFLVFPQLLHPSASPSAYCFVKIDTDTHTVLTQLKDIEVNVCVLWYSSWYSRLLQSLDMVFEFDQFLPLQVVEMYRNAFQTDQFLCGNDPVLWHSAKSPAWIWNRPVIILMYIESLSSWQVDSVFWIAKAGLEIKRRAGEMKVLNHWIRYFQTTHPHDFCFAVRAMAEGDLWVAVFVGKASSKQLGPK